MTFVTARPILGVWVCEECELWVCDMCVLWVWDVWGRVYCVCVGCVYCVCEMCIVSVWDVCEGCVYCVYCECVSVWGFVYCVCWTLGEQLSVWVRGCVYCVCRTLGEQLSRDPDLLTKKMGPKLQTLLHVAATFNRYTVGPWESESGGRFGKIKNCHAIVFFF